MNFKDKIFYHGSNNKFTTFDKSKIRENKLGLCFNFTDDYSMAYQYGDNILKVHLDLNNPITREVFDSKWTFEQDNALAQKLGYPPLKKEEWKDWNEKFYEIYDIHKMKPEFIELLQEMGYDGIALPEDHHYGVFEPEQIHIIDDVNESLDNLPFNPNTKTWYHGTTEYFDKFTLNKFGTRDRGFLGKGIYLDGSFGGAEFYSFGKSSTIPEDAHVYICKVNIKNPYIILNDERYDVYEYQLKDDLNVFNNSEITKVLKEKGYDSVLKCNEIQGLNTYSVELCVFDPDNIKIIDEVKTCVPCPEKEKRYMYMDKPLTERFEEIERNVFATDSGYDIINRMKNKPQAYRIIYDGNIGYYFIGDAFDYIHQDMLEHAYYQGFYPSMLSANECDDYMNQCMEEQSMILFAFDPDGGGMLDAEKSSDGYTRKYVYDFGTIYAHEFTPFENCPLYKLLGEPIKKENVFEDFKTLNEMLERYIEEENKIGNYIIEAPVIMSDNVKSFLQEVSNAGGSGTVTHVLRKKQQEKTYSDRSHQSGNKFDLRLTDIKDNVEKIAERVKPILENKKCKELAFECLGTNTKESKEISEKIKSLLIEKSSIIKQRLENKSLIIWTDWGWEYSTFTHADICLYKN